MISPSDKKELEAFEGSEAASADTPRYRGTLEALEYVLGGLRDLPGRKAIFLVSDGFAFCRSGVPIARRMWSEGCASSLTLPIGLPRSSTQSVRKDCRRSRWTRAWTFREPWPTAQWIVQAQDRKRTTYLAVTVADGLTWPSRRKGSSSTTTTTWRAACAR